jgi:diguanylate cyclase (GGDEF)-like protein
MSQSATIRSESDPSEKDRAERARQIQSTMRHVGRRQWWLWSSAFMVTILLTLGIASFAFPGLLRQESIMYPIELNLALRSLVGLVLLFNIYTIYQQLQIRRLQDSLAEQVCAMDKVEARTEEVFKLAVLDSLTGLYNRRCGEQRLAEEISRSQRHGHPLTVIALDLNGLKYVNDTFGHAAGDDLIKCFAGRINKAIRGADLAVRQGGDEFLLLLPECKPEDVRHVLGRLSGIRLDLGRQTIPVEFSAGWTNYIPGESREELLQRADKALYANKRAGKEQNKEQDEVRSVAPILRP